MQGHCLMQSKKKFLSEMKHLHSYNPLVSLGWLLSSKQSKPLLDCDSLSAVFVLGREPCGVGREGGSPRWVFFVESVDPSVVAVEIVHEVHGGIRLILSISCRSESSNISLVVGVGREGGSP